MHTLQSVRRSEKEKKFPVESAQQRPILCFEFSEFVEPSGIGCTILLLLFYIPIKLYKNKQGLQDDATRSMEIHSNPVTITFNIDIQIDITFKYYK